MFGKKTTANGRTVLLLDIESGSVGSALLNLSKKDGPYAYAYHREHAPLQLSRTSESLFASLDKTLATSLTRAAEVAARMRASNMGFGDVAHIAVFLAAPWGMPNLPERKPTFGEGIVGHLTKVLSGFFGNAGTSFHTSADALAFSTKNIAPGLLLASLRSELIELLLFAGQKVAAYGTVPVGSSSILRTLRTHGALSEHEARSFLALTVHTDRHYEPLVAAGEHLRGEFFDGASQLLRYGAPEAIVVLGERALSEWLAKRIAEEERLVGLVSAHATVESFKQSYFGMPFSHSAVADPHILAAAAFVDARASLWRGVY